MWKEFCWKNLIRFFITPKTKSTFSYSNNHAGDGVGSRTQIILVCFENVQKWEIIGMMYELPKSCEILYLCNLTSENVQSEDRYLAKILLAAAKKAITTKWCREDSPTLENWLNTVQGILDMERFTHILRFQQAEFNLKWDKWTEYKSQSRDTTGDWMKLKSFN